MLASLTISSDERLHAIASAFGREFAAAAEVPEGERPRFAGALDHAVRFVRERAYPGDPTGRIELTLSLAERGVQASLHDWGRPLTSAEGPDILLDLGDEAEDLRLINLGADGKRLSFLWRTSHAAEIAAGAADTPPAAVDAAEVEGVIVRAGHAEDAEPIAQLLYANYSLSYVHPDFYRPRWLREQLLSGRVVSSVAEHDGQVIGHHALLRAADGALAETGVAVVAAAYRGLGLFGRLSDHTLEQAAALGLEAVFGRAVTMHPYSQRAELAHGYRESALCLAASPAARRRALIVSFLPLRRSHRRAALPEPYRDRLLETYDALGLPAPAPAPAANGPGSPGAIAVTRVAEATAAVVTIRGWDDVLAAEALAAIRTLLAEHVDVIYADVDLEATADPDRAVAFLRGQGFSYAGLWLHGPGNHDHLRLQRLNSAAVELDEIVTASARGEELVRYVLADLEQVGGRGG